MSVRIQSARVNTKITSKNEHDLLFHRHPSLHFLKSFALLLIISTTVVSTLYIIIDLCSPFVSELADLRDEHGNSSPLTDEYGNPMHLPGVATTQTTTDQTQLQPGPEVHGETGVRHGNVAAPIGVHEGKHKELKEQLEEERQHEGTKKIQRSSSSSSSSSEDDGQGGRRKKALKEKLMGGKHKEEHSHTTSEATTTTAEEGQHHKHEKKSMMEKIKEKLPGGHSTH